MFGSFLPPSPCPYRESLKRYFVIAIWGWGCGSVVEHFPSPGEALSLISSITNNNNYEKKTHVHETN
jgi:hypothetical protein